MPDFVNHFSITPVSKGTIVGALLAGCVVGSLASAYFSDRIGRKNTIMWAAVVFIFGALLQSSAYSFAQLYVGRTVAGLSIGCSRWSYHYTNQKLPQLSCVVV